MKSESCFFRKQSARFAQLTGAGAGFIYSTLSVLRADIILYPELYPLRLGISRRNNELHTPARVSLSNTTQFLFTVLLMTLPFLSCVAVSSQLSA